MVECGILGDRAADMSVVIDAEQWGDATLEFNGHSLDLTDGNDLQILEIVMQHRPCAEKLLDLLANLTEGVKNSEVAA